MIKPYKGKFQTEWYTNATSATFEVNDLVYLSSGVVTKFADSVDQVPLGLIQEKITATDTKYSTAGKVPVLVGDVNSEYLCDVSTGTAVSATHVGTWIDVDDENSVDVNASTYDIFFVTNVVSTSQVVAKMQSLDPYQ
jgi:hypothetical protein